MPISDVHANQVALIRGSRRPSLRFHLRLLTILRVTTPSRHEPVQGLAPLPATAAPTSHSEVLQRGYASGL
jgi:hypothetical protein